MQQHHSVPWTSSRFPSRKNESQIESKRLDNEKVKKNLLQNNLSGNLTFNLDYRVFDICLTSSFVSYGLIYFAVF
jgi:hypothetical protein